MPEISTGSLGLDGMAVQAASDREARATRTEWSAFDRRLHALLVLLARSHRARTARRMISPTASSSCIPRRSPERTPRLDRRERLGPAGRLAQLKSALEKALGAENLNVVWPHERTVNHSSELIFVEL